jgi:sulfate adenylyltransferase subunit 1
VRFVPVSALGGDMVVDRGANLDWYDGPTLLQILETVEVPQRPAEAPLRFPIQYVARPTATPPRGYMGRIESGALAVGDRVVALPTGRRRACAKSGHGTAPGARGPARGRDAGARR